MAKKAGKGFKGGARTAQNKKDVKKAMRGANKQLEKLSGITQG